MFITVLVTNITVHLFVIATKVTHVAMVNLV
jgi:hypothetical protein